MKHLLVTLIATTSLGFSQEPEDPGRQTPFSLEITLGGGGVEVGGDSTFGFDVSVGTNPFESAPSIWVGVVQGMYWEPRFSGSTDLYADYSFRLWSDSLWLNLGWTVGAVYDTETVAWRTGPETSLQYYLTDEAFIYVGANYDLYLSGGQSDGLRYGFGLGIQF